MNDVLKAKCEAPIRVEIIDRSTGVPVGEDIADVHLEVRYPIYIYPIRCAVRHAVIMCSDPALQRFIRSEVTRGPADLLAISTCAMASTSIASRRHEEQPAAVTGSPKIWRAPQMAVLDGNAYDAKCLEAGHERDEDLDSCSLLLNNKGTALLQPGASASHSLQHKVVVQLQVRARLPPPGRRCRALSLGRGNVQGFYGVGEGQAVPYPVKGEGRHPVCPGGGRASREGCH